ncbi:MAG: molecular chaperone DjlA [Candidatus Marinimicrobia bacterium]|nr:molecular chaperone DjlA [Candidatus Neomarinimicrobiota bacterium]|tara:strand:+ start:3403 stop:4107 length:705 start_codon:yes stop_codon:yes gene_type:complete
MSWNKLLFGALGWAMFGPIGGILGYSLGAQSNSYSKYSKNTKSGDFGAALLILLAAVMKADGKILKSELDYVKNFLINNFGKAHAKQALKMLKELLNKDFPLNQVCEQIQQNMDHPSRLQLMHVLFGLSASDGEVHPEEIRVIKTIGNYLNINAKDFESIQAMFYRDTESAYKVLEIDKSAKDTEIKKAYRKMAIKYHPDKVGHLGEDFQKMAEEKFKQLNEAYQKIKSNRNII